MARGMKVNNMSMDDLVALVKSARDVSDKVARRIVNTILPELTKEQKEEREHRKWAAEGYPITNEEILKKINENEIVGVSAQTARKNKTQNGKNRGGLTKSGHKDYRGTGMFYGGMAKKANKK